jgi:hypothetical protein
MFGESRLSAQLLLLGGQRTRDLRSGMPFMALSYVSECTLRQCYLTIYNNPFRTSQETHHVSATEPNRLTLC